MARGAWLRAMTPALTAAGVGDIDRDPFGLFTSGEPIQQTPYSDGLYKAMFGVEEGR